MAKKIKTIKCPKCGSINKTEISKDTFLCSDCNTKYFLDNDYVNINVTERTTTNNPNPKKANPASVVISVVIILSLFIIPRICRKTSISNSTSTFTNSLKAKEKGNIRATKIISDKNSTDVHSIIFEIRRGSTYFTLYDVLNKKVLKETKLRDGGQKYSSDYFYSLIEFRDALYVIERKGEQKNLFKISSPENLVLENMADILESSHPKLSGGIANFKTLTYTNGFEILTNDGETYAYSTYSDKLYESYRELQKDASIPTHNVKYYGFTNGLNYNKNIQLLELNTVIQDKKGKSFSLGWEYGGKLEALWFNGKWKFSKDVTPGRKYFSASNSIHEGPVILANNDKEIFVLVRASANPAASLNIQSISIETGDVNWTAETNLEEKRSSRSDNEFVELKDKYIFRTSNKFYQLNKSDPSKITEIDLSNDF